VAGSGSFGVDEDECQPTGLALHDNVFFIADKQNNRVLRWPLGEDCGRVVAGRGVKVNGNNDIGVWFAIAVTTDGALLIADHDHDRVLRFGAPDGQERFLGDELPEGGQIVGKGQWKLRNPKAVASVRGGAIYVLDWDGTRVQKLDNGVATVVAGGNGEGPNANQFRGSVGGMFVTDSGSIYISDSPQKRIQRWEPGATSGTTVAGGHGVGSLLHQLGTTAAGTLPGVFVSSNEDVYVADCQNDRIVKWSKGATSGVVVAGGCGRGDGLHQLSSPTGVVCDDSGSIFVCEAGNFRVCQWGPSPGIVLNS